MSKKVSTPQEAVLEELQRLLYAYQVNGTKIAKFANLSKTTGCRHIKHIGEMRIQELFDVMAGAGIPLSELVDAVERGVGKWRLS